MTFPVRASGRLLALASLAAVALAAAVAVAVWQLRSNGGATVVAVAGVHGLTGSGDDLWAAAYDGSDVVRIDARSGRVVGRYGVGRRPTNPSLGNGALWVPVLDRKALVEVDPGSGRVRTAVHGLYEAVLPEADGVWALAWPDAPAHPTSWRGRTIVRLDPETGRVLARAELDGIGLGLAAAGGYVWTANFSGHAVSRVSRTTGRVSAVTVGARSFAVAARGRTVWVAIEGDRIVELDAATGRRLRSVAVTGNVDYMTADARGVWVAAYADSEHAELVHMDGDTGAIDRRVEVGGASQGLAVAGGRVWVADYGHGTVTAVAKPVGGAS